jgi:hypothetical protein
MEIKTKEEAIEFIKNYDGTLAIFCDGGWDYSPYSKIYFCPSDEYGTDGQIELGYINKLILLELQIEGIIDQNSCYGGLKCRAIFEVNSKAIKK